MLALNIQEAFSPRLFNSIHFAIFFPTLLIVNFSLPHRYRLVLLLVVSYYFYMNWKPEYVLLLLGSTGVSWICGNCLERTKDIKKRKWIFASGISAFLLYLVFFKYWNFRADQVNTVSGALKIHQALPHHGIHLLIGIYFFTFLTLSYLIDVY